MENSLYSYISEQPPDEGIALNDNTLSSLLLGGAFAKTLGKGAVQTFNTVKEYAPYAKDIWEGRELLIHKPFDKMTPEEYTKYGDIGKQYFKTTLNPQTSHNPIIGDVKYPNKSAGKPDYKYMEQYPFMRYNIDKATNNKYIPNNKNRADAKGFDNLKVNWKGKDYAYQIKNSAYNQGKNFHNIKPYELLELE